VTEIFKQFTDGRRFKQSMAPKSQYLLADECSAFYNGDQWRGVPVKDTNPTPVLNVERTIVNRKVAEIRPYSVSARYRIDSLPENHPAAEYVSTAQDVLNGIAKAKWNALNMATFSLKACTQAAVEGMAVAYTYWDSGYESFSADALEKIRGDFVTELIPAVNIYLGAPNVSDIQTQPYIIIAIRKTVSEIKAIAKANGKNEQTLKRIVPDSLYETQVGDNRWLEPSGKNDEEGRAMILYRFHKKDGTVYCSCSTMEVDIFKDRDLRLSRYPISTFLWCEMGSLGYGIPECWDIHKNQIAINRAMGSCIKNLLLTGSPKLLYDNTMIHGWTNQIGGTQAVNGNTSTAARFVDPPRMGSESIAIVEYLYKTTMEMKGVSDALMGTSTSNSAKALALVQAQASQFLKLEQEKFYQFIKDIFSTWLDFFKNHYDVDRVVRIPNSMGEEQFVTVNGNLFADMPISVSIDVGTGGEWSEMSMVESILEMITAGHLDPLTGFEMLPSSYFANKQKTLETLRRNQAAALQMQGKMGNSSGPSDAASLVGAASVAPPGADASSVPVPQV